MIYEEHFARVQRQSLLQEQMVETPSGLSIFSKCTSWAGLYEAFKGEDGTELVIGEQCEVEIHFNQEVEKLCLEYYVVSDHHYDDVQMLFDTDGYDMDLCAPAPRSFYWLTLSGSGYTDSWPGPIATQPYYQEIVGPFRRLTISTSRAGTVHIRRLEWTRTCRH
ncbi:hypothetical protein [Pseudomonas sp. PSKL.D1]|uniref:hypothetical protein n=1 Tax=Pseudomonas sp. PSKL.D1 TaxID=3029060 RepID=UPI0023817AE3|nr:hypothetical protein [Pseudomonas sp. PSKL.D1]WDY58475.1 hypothetical protein PVV54_02210 [Pseudomonas sp. PSKL.D1]